jgi:hypothetical protein
MLCNIKQGNVLWLGFVKYGILRIQLRKTPPAAIVSKQPVPITPQNLTL